MQNYALVLHPHDNVATALTDLSRGETVTVTIGQQPVSVVLHQNIPFGHKFSLRQISRSEDIIKYGECIGSALTSILAGEHVHVQNIESKRGRGDLCKTKCCGNMSRGDTKFCKKSVLSP